MEQDKLHIPFTERLKSIPEMFGIRLNEEPRYQTLRKEGDIELRRYEPQVVARVGIEANSFDEFRKQAFRRLASYFFGLNEGFIEMQTSTSTMEKTASKKSTQISMTSPVLEEQMAPDLWVMSFILPAKYTLQTAPKPLDPEITLELVPGFQAAVIQYTGNNTEKNIEIHEKKLNEWLESQPQLMRSGNPLVAQYDAPFVIPFLKKNEVQIKVAEFH